MEEIWKDIPGYEGLYQINNLGQVKTMNWEHTQKQKILKFRHLTSGYLGVSLYKDGKECNRMVHRLVAQTFIPNPESFPCVNHKNEIKTDNRVENLEWCSYSYNNTYNGKQKRIRKTLKNKGNKYGGIPIYQVSLTGEIIRKFDSIYEAEKELGLRHIGESCKNPKRYKTIGGYRWVYADSLLYKNPD